MVTTDPRLRRLISLIVDTPHLDDKSKWRLIQFLEQSDVSPTRVEKLIDLYENADSHYLSYLQQHNNGLEKLIRTATNDKVVAAESTETAEKELVLDDILKEI